MLHHASPAADVWAFAVLAMELAFGRPLAALSEEGSGAGVTGLHALPYLHLLPLPDLAEVLAACLRWDHSERPSFDQLLEQLLCMLAGS